MVSFTFTKLAVGSSEKKERIQRMLGMNGKWWVMDSELTKMSTTEGKKFSSM